MPDGYKLSRSQILALESCYLFFRTLRPLLSCLGSEVYSLSTRTQLKSTLDSCARREADLLINFEEVARAAERWNLRGGR